jgi:hypothetical protein
MPDQLNDINMNSFDFPSTLASADIDDKMLLLYTAPMPLRSLPDLTEA